MSQHIIPEDSYNHIQDIACGCKPIVTIVEGEELCIHKIKDPEILKDMANRLEFTVENKQYWLSFEDYEKVRKFRGYSGK